MATNQRVLKINANIKPAPKPRPLIAKGTTIGIVIAPAMGVNATNERIFLSIHEIS